MGWIEGLNDAMDYIERNLEGDLDVARAARLAACSLVPGLGRVTPGVRGRREKSPRRPLPGPSRERRSFDGKP